MKAIDKYLSVVLLSSILIILGNYVFSANKLVKKYESKKDTVSISLSSTMRSILNDFQSNPARFDINWGKKYITFRGNVSQISDYEIILSNQDKSIPPIVCDWALGQKEFIARLQPGYSVSVIGRLSVDKRSLYRYLDESQLMFRISDCKIMNFKQEA